VTGPNAAGPKGARPYWALRVAESTLLVSALAGIALFAWSLVDIIRIETALGATAATRELPAGAWPGIFIFFGSMVALQFVRMFLQRYRRDDGTRRGDERSAALASAEVLADTAPAEPAATSPHDNTDA
jgi:TRAP-type C4-dicarboxylate transport system permease small subunit